METKSVTLKDASPTYAALTEQESLSEIGVKLIYINEKLKDLCETRSEIINKAVALGIDKKMIARENEDGTWTRVKIVNNVERIEGGGYFEFLKVEPYTVKIDNLKNKPKELR